MNTLPQATSITAAPPTPGSRGCHSSRALLPLVERMGAVIGTGRQLFLAATAGVVIAAGALAQGPASGFLIVNDRPGTFTDISATGATISGGLDRSTAFTSGVTNALVTTPSLFASTNGNITAAAFSSGINSELPVATQTLGLFPLWDGLFVDLLATLKHQLVVENGVSVEVVQWTQVRSSGFSSARGTFEIKIFASGPVLAQFLYQTLVVIDEQGNRSLPDEIVVRIPQDTVPPTANAGPDQSVHANVVTLDGRASYDNVTDSSALSYQWTITAAPAGSNAFLYGGGRSSSDSLFMDLFGDYRVSLVVTDEQGNRSDPDEVLISPYNLAPTADAGPDQIVVINSPVSLDGGNSSDPDSADGPPGTDHRSVPGSRAPRTRRLTTSWSARAQANADASSLSPWWRRSPWQRCCSWRRDSTRRQPLTPGCRTAQRPAHPPRRSPPLPP